MLFQLTQMSQDYIESIVSQIVKNIAKEMKNKFRGRAVIEENHENEINSHTVQETLETKGQESSTTNEDKRDEDKHENTDSTETVKEDNSDNKKENDVSSSLDKQENEQSVEDDAKDAKGDKKEEPQPQKKEEEQNPTSIFFHFTLFLLWGIVTCMCLPAVLTWAHNFR